MFTISEISIFATVSPLSSREVASLRLIGKFSDSYNAQVIFWVLKLNGFEKLLCEQLLIDLTLQK